MCNPVNLMMADKRQWQVDAALIEEADIHDSPLILPGANVHGTAAAHNLALRHDSNLRAKQVI